MVYAGNIGQQNVSLGVSGRLDGREHRNLIMWDEETNSLWSQIKGEALHGESKGKTLDMLPAIFVGLGTWKKMHPKTLVLDMETVRSRGWFYKTTDMERGSTRGRGGPLALGLGIRHQGEALVVSNDRIKRDGVVNVEVGGIPLAMVWVADHSVPLVYDRRVGDRTPEFRLSDGNITTGKLAFDPLTGKGESSTLKRFPYIPTYIKAWQSYYPKGKTLE